MAEILDSRVINLDDAESSADVDVIIDYDHQLNLYDDGETTTTFYKDEDIYLLMQIEQGYRIESIESTSGGVQNLGLVPRTLEVQDDFFIEGEEKSLKWNPSSNVVVTNDHLQTGSQIITKEGKIIECNNPPSVLDYQYQFQAYSLKVSHSADMDISEDEIFPLGIHVKVIK